MEQVINEVSMLEFVTIARITQSCTLYPIMSPYYLAKILTAKTEKIKLVNYLNCPAFPDKNIRLKVFYIDNYRY